MRGVCYVQIKEIRSVGLSATSSAPFSSRNLRPLYPQPAPMKRSPAFFAVSISISLSPTITQSSRLTPSFLRARSVSAGLGFVVIVSVGPTVAEKVPFFAKERASDTLYINSAAAKGSVIRQRRTGDVIKKFGGGSKPLKEFLIDIKCERRTRDLLPVCAIGNEVVFVAGVEISADAAVTGKETYKIIYKRR